MTYLLDINVLIAPLDAGHVQHEAAHEWFGRVGHSAWATCPLTENGVVRVIRQPALPEHNGDAGPGRATRRKAARILAFLSDNLSLLDRGHVDASRILATDQVTDTYLLALARLNGVPWPASVAG